MSRCKHCTDPSAVFVESTLPEHYPNPHITLPIAKLKDFNKNLHDLAGFTAEVCNTTPEKLCTYDLLRYEARHNRMLKAAEKLKVYVNNPKAWAAYDQTLSSAIARLLEEIGK